MVKGVESGCKGVLLRADLRDFWLASETFLRHPHFAIKLHTQIAGYTIYPNEMTTPIYIPLLLVSIALRITGTNRGR